MTIYRSRIDNASTQLLDAIQSCTDSFADFTANETFSMSVEAYKEVCELVELNSDCTVQLIDTIEY